MLNDPLDRTLRVIAVLDPKTKLVEVRVTGRGIDRADKIRVDQEDEAKRLSVAVELCVREAVPFTYK